MTRNLAEWLAYQEHVNVRSIELGLDRVRKVWQRMGAPAPAQRVITVGGTNGKGSTVALLEAMLTAAGLRVGAFTSPHLLDYNERVRIDGENVDDAALIGLRFANGRIGQVASVGYRNGAVTFAMDLVCEDGTVRIDFDQGVFTGRGGVWTPVPDSIEPNWMSAAVAREWRAFADSIVNDTASPVSGAYGRHVVACIEAAHQASAARREIPVIGMTQI